MRRHCRWGVVIVALAAGTGGAAHADCLDWRAATAWRDGRIEAFPGVGALRYRQATRAVGYGHHRQALAVQWRDGGGRLHEQVLFDRIGGEPFPTLAPDARGLAVRSVDCAFRGLCRERVEHYRHDATDGRFRGTAHWADFAFDPDDGTWRRAAAPTPPGDRADDAAADGCDTPGAFSEAPA